MVRRGDYDPNLMISVFFKSTGPVLIDVLENNKTIDNFYYIENVLKLAVEEINRQRPKSTTKNFKILHDNARPHVHKNVVSYLESQGMIIISHPPYLPDLSPCDYWLKDYIKQRLNDHNDRESLKSQR